MLIEDLVTAGKMLWKEGVMASKKLTFGNSMKSLSHISNEATYYFPTVFSDQVTADELGMMIKCLERNYAVFTRTAFSFIPAIEVNNITDSTVRDYLAKFHRNIGQMPTMSASTSISGGGMNLGKGIFSESSSELNLGVLNESNKESKTVKMFLESNGQNPAKKDKPKGPRMANFVDTDWKKANELVPTTITAPIRVVNSSTSNDFVVDVPVNIKATAHKASSSQLVDNVSRSIAQGRGFLNFIKFISGEQKSLTDFLFGIKNMKQDLVDQKNSPWLDAFKRRRRLARLTWGAVADNYKPTGTVVLTMNEVNILKNQYDIDVFKEAKKIMDQYFLLGFAILDQANETAHIMFDSQPTFQDYPYRTLEREAGNQDKAVRDMLRMMGRV